MQGGDKTGNRKAKRQPSMRFETVRSATPRTLVTSVVGDLQRRIVNREFPQGEQLPPERQLMEMLEVSRPVLREALSRLEALGLVENRSTRGRFIRDGGSPECSQSLAAAWLHQHAQELGEIDELRAMVEARAVEHMSEDEARGAARSGRIHLLIQEAALEHEDALAAAEADGDFHTTLCSHSPNGVLKELVNVLIEQARTLVAAVYASPENRQRSMDQHTEILKALERGDCREAATLVAAHHLEPSRFS